MARSEDRAKAGAVSRGQLRLFLILGAFSAVAFLLAFKWNLMVRTRPYHDVIAVDFMTFWFASKLILQGDLATVFQPWPFSHAMQAFIGGPPAFQPFPYPPSALWFTLPWALLPYGASLALWLGSTFALFAWSLRRFFASTGTCALVLMAAPSSLVNIIDGQNGFLSAALLCGGLLLVERRPLVAGLLFGLLTFKPQLGILLPFILLAGGWYRAFAAAVVVAIALQAASLAILGSAPWLQYLGDTLPFQRVFLETGTGPFVVMVPTFFMSARFLGLPNEVGYGVQIAMALAALVLCCWVARAKVPLERKLPVLIMGPLLASPYCFNYDMGLATAAVVIAWNTAPKPEPWERIAYAIAWLLPVAMVAYGIMGLPVAPVALWLTFWVLVRRATQPARSSRLPIEDARSAAA
ncbi:MAG TPA: glycosyltransferase family 87 protein [Candidatus Cybelea sp.]|nr:glycosyltransferase family 87 protein [Candidatus Cybelea sp.]